MLPTQTPTSPTTLDEPVLETLKRDVMQVGKKMRCVVLPRGNTLDALRDWDLWGPLILCLTLAIALSAQAPEGQAALVFGSVFVIVWCGAGVVTLNALLLGGKISFFQSVCVLGYCLFPLTLSAIVCLIYGHIAFRLVVVGVGFFWSTGASVGFMGETVPKSRRLLSVYPVFLFYIAISWMLLLK
eukprot:comp12423_c0_seq2/m.16272 comp12423_c0_seq2/g.16272  ORF comp12423_c0_seq2/g.16272 comp12423_c0_seq2/m.16272 type:complete len:185 (-) comp12423_c0_seq2:56-610(-)